MSIISRDLPGSDDYYSSSGVSRIRLGRPAIDKIGRAGSILNWLVQLRRTVRQIDPDVAVGFMHSSFLPLGLSLAGTGIPVVASEHTVFDHYASRPLERALLHATPLLVDATTVVSEQARASFPASLRDNMIIVPNPVSMPRSGRVRTSEDTRLLVAVGRLDKAKDHKTLIGAFAEVAMAHPSWNLEIAGEGDLRHDLELQIARLNMSHRVRLLGAVADVHALLARASVFAMASRYESFGLATAEALMHGIPAIGFADCPGTNELIRDGWNGLLIDPGTNREAAFANGLAILFESSELRANLGGNARRSVENFATSIVADKWEEVLMRLARK